MFNMTEKAEALKKLENKVEEFKRKHSLVIENSKKLYLMKKDSLELIKMVDMFSKMITNTSKSVDESFNYILINKKDFDYAVRLEKNSNRFNKITKGSVVGGIATGVGVAALAPTAAMAIATTFGTASTGAAISSLTGAAATNAALAWLGGGTLAAGGGGMVAGNTLLALAGPIGWAIGGGAMVIGGIALNKKNKKIIEEAKENIRDLNNQITDLDNSNKKVINLNNRIEQAYNELKNQYIELGTRLYFDYEEYTNQDKILLDNLIENACRLSKLLNEKIVEE